jgi:hypothetical protein
VLTHNFHVSPPSDTVETLRMRRALLEALRPHVVLAADIEEIVQVATALLDLAQQYYDAGESERATDTLRFVDETLVELNGPAGAVLRAADIELDWAALPSEYDGESGVGEPKHGMQDHYRSASRIRFVRIPRARSAAMGHDLPIEIPFEVIGDAPEADYTIHIALRDPLGIRTVAETTVRPNPPTSQWVPGKQYLQRTSLPIPRDDTQKGVSQPVVLDQMHDVIVSLRDETSGTSILLDNPPGHHPNRIGQGYLLKQVYVSSAPIEIYGGGVSGGDSISGICIGIMHHGPAMKVKVLFRVLTPSGRPLAEYARDVALKARDERFAIGTGPVAMGTARIATGKKYRGNVIADVRIYGEDGLLTRMTEPMREREPDEGGPTFTRANHVERNETEVSTPIHLRREDWSEPLDVVVRAGPRILAAYNGVVEDTVLRPPPHFGYYDITATSGDTIWHERLVATVIQAEGGQLLVNGEPFIVKGVNVHGMDGRSPARTRVMMEILKDLGFNSLRGDYPPRWQIDMAHEMGLTYDVLAPFSVASSAEIFGRQDGPPLGTARALTRQFIERYADAAAVLLWNSCNEILGENIPFLLAQHPLYKIHDPYQRPVHYANLFGQDLWQGQDVIGVNYYFSDTQKAVDRQPLIRRSAAIAAEHGLPMIYTEFNSYHGAVPTTGVEALDDLFTWGVEEAGMAGGYFYMKGNSDRHPGVFDDGYNTHRIMDDAFHRAFDDAEVTVHRREEQHLTLEVRNRRPFALRRVTLDAYVSGRAVSPIPLPDLAPYASKEIRIAIPREAPGPDHVVTGELHSETHSGLAGSVPF